MWVLIYVLKEVWYYIVCIFINMIYCEVGSRRWFSQKGGLPACQRKKLKGWIRGAGHTWGRGRLNSKLHLLLAMPCQAPPSLLATQLYLFCTPDHSPVYLLSGALLTSAISTSQQSLWFYLFEFWQKWNHLSVETSLILFQSWQEFTMMTTTTGQRW